MAIAATILQRIVVPIIFTLCKYIVSSFLTEYFRFKRRRRNDVRDIFALCDSINQSLTRRSCYFDYLSIDFDQHESRTKTISCTLLMKTDSKVMCNGRMRFVLRRGLFKLRKWAGTNSSYRFVCFFWRNANITNIMPKMLFHSSWARISNLESFTRLFSFKSHSLTAHSFLGSKIQPSR